MPEFKKFPKGNVKKNVNFYGWASIFVAVGGMGLLTIITGEFIGRDGSVIFEGDAATVVGTVFLAYAAYALYHMFARLEKIEKAHEEFHQLDNFEEKIFEHDTRFEILNAHFPRGRSGFFVFYYILEIKLNKPIKFNLNVKQRNTIEYILWKIGLTRIFDILTSNYYFDSKYRVKCSDRIGFKRIFNIDVVHLLENFDRDYPPIRERNGNLEITQEKIKYIEGPYAQDQNLLDPHRGCIEKLFMELIKIISEIERSI